MPPRNRADDHIRVGQAEVEDHTFERTDSLRIADEVVQIVVVGREQDQRTQTGGTNGVALGHGLGGVADRVERIRRDTHAFFHLRHLRDATGVVRYRAVCVEGDNHTGSASIAVVAMAMPNRPAKA